MIYLTPVRESSVRVGQASGGVSVNVSSRSCNHPLFRWASEAPGWSASEGIIRPCVFVFERSRWITPTPQEISRYQKSRRIVEKLGGCMSKREWEIAGEAQKLSHEEVSEILAAVQRDNPDATIIAHWNGEGCYTMSVGVDLAAERKSAA